MAGPRCPLGLYIQRRPRSGQWSRATPTECTPACQTDNELRRVVQRDKQRVTAGYKPSSGQEYFPGRKIWSGPRYMPGRMNTNNVVS